MIKDHPLIYIVEDDKPFSIMLKKYLYMKGFRNIEIIHTGEECLANIDKKPKIIIQDYELPGMNGFEVFKKVKEKNENIEFLFLSGQRSVQVAVDIIKHGAYDYVVKDDIAKEYIEKKLKLLIHLKKIERKRKINKQGMILFAVALAVTWIVILILFLTHVIRF